MTDRADKTIEMFTSGQSIHLTLIGDQPARHCALVEEHSGRGLRLRTERPLEVGAAVKFEEGSALYLAEVTACHGEGGGYAVHVEIAHALLHTDELAQLARRLLEEAERPR